MFEKFKEGMKKGKEEGERERKQEQIGREYLRDVRHEELGQKVGRALAHPEGVVEGAARGAVKTTRGAMSKVKASAKSGALHSVSTKAFNALGNVGERMAAGSLGPSATQLRGPYRAVPKVKERRQRRQKRQPEEPYQPTYMDMLRGSPEPGGDYGSMVAGNVSPESYLDRLAGSTGMARGRKKRGGGGTGGLPYKL